MHLKFIPIGNNLRKYLLIAHVDVKSKQLNQLNLQLKVSPFIRTLISFKNNNSFIYFLCPTNCDHLKKCCNNTFKVLSICSWIIQKRRI